jgi:tetratricopeptide (TPR) repeat protein
MKLSYLPLLLLLGLVAAPRGASAGPSSDPKAAAAADASGRAHFQRGQKLSASGDYAAAYREFAAGYALTERPLFLFNMAEAARGGGDVAKARENYLEFLRVDPSNELAVTAKTRLAELDRAAAGPGPTGPTGPAGPATTPAVTTTPGGTHEPLPLLPPSATHPSGGGAGEPLPVDRPVTSARAEGTPIYKKWPFWAVVGVAVVAGGAAVYATSRDGDPCGAGCTQINFR